MIIIKTIIIILNQPLLNSALKTVLSHHFNIAATSTNANDMIALCEKYNWGVHPMISYEGIDNIIENYKWFKKKFK